MLNVKSQKKWVYMHSHCCSINLPSGNSLYVDVRVFKSNSEDVFLAALLYY